WLRQPSFLSPERNLPRKILPRAKHGTRKAGLRAAIQCWPSSESPPARPADERADDKAAPASRCAAPPAWPVGRRRIWGPKPVFARPAPHFGATNRKGLPGATRPGPAILAAA